MNEQRFDKERSSESGESGIRTQSGIVGFGVGGESRIGYERRTIEDRASTPENRSVVGDVPSEGGSVIHDPHIDDRVFNILDDSVGLDRGDVVRRIISHVDSVVNEIASTIKRNIGVNISHIVASVDYCESCIRGCFGRICDRIGDILTKCERKIVNSVADHLSNAYYYTYPYFGSPPTIEEILGVPSGTSITAQSVVGPGQGHIPSPSCPPGTRPQWDSGEQRWVCVADCPSGTVPDPISGRCFPQQEPIPPSKPPCPVERPPAGVPDPIRLPPPSPPEPPCPAPVDVVCPPGMVWHWNGSTWRCVPISSEKPKPGTGDHSRDVCIDKEPEGTCISGNTGPDKALIEGLQGVINTLVQNWNEPQVCDIVDSIKKGVEVDLTKVIPWYYDEQNNKWVVPLSVQGALLSTNSIVRHAILSTIGSLIGVGQQLIRMLPSIGGCDIKFVPHHLVLSALLDFVEQYTGIKFDALRSSVRYSINYHCPHQLPDQSSINQLYYSRLIDDAQWRCLTRSIGNLDYWQRLIREANRPDLTPDQLAAAYWRGLLPKAELEKRLVERYGLPAEVAANYDRLTMTLPGIGDVVRFMVRDVADEQVTKKYQYDAEFEEKWAGKLREWTRNLGIDEETMRYYWRAHWELPSPTQLYEMMRRLRKDSVDPTAQKLAIDEAEIAAALAAQDIPQYWRERLMAIAFLPMTPSDAKQAFIDDAITEDELRSIIRDSGRNAHHTELIVNMMRRQKARRSQNLIGSYSPKTVTQWFKSGAIDEEQAEVMYLEAGLTREQALDAIRKAKKAIKAERIQRKIQIIRRRYMVGDLLADQAKSMLVKIGVEVEKADELVDEWETEISVRSKQVAATMLCNWYYRNLITEEEYAIRLRRIGYQPADVARIVAECSAASIERRFDRTVKNIRGRQTITKALKGDNPNGKPPT